MEDSVYDGFPIFLSHWVYLRELLPRDLRDYSALQDITKKDVELGFQ